MDAEPNELEQLAAATKRYNRTHEAARKAREEVVEAVAAALRAGFGPAEVARTSPFTDAYVRSIRAEHGIAPGKPGMKPRKKRGEQ